MSMNMLSHSANSLILQGFDPDQTQIVLQKIQSIHTNTNYYVTKNKMNLKSIDESIC